MIKRILADHVRVSAGRRGNGWYTIELELSWLAVTVCVVAGYAGWRLLP